MSLPTWTPAELSSEASDISCKVWRMVEGQHVVSTLQVVDTRAEQELLEEILEENKPPVPVEAVGLHYLLFSPFRYDTRPPYAATQALGRSAREAGVGAVTYQSVRDPQPHFCIAILTPRAFAAKKPVSSTQTWVLAVSAEEAIWMRQGDEGFSFSTRAWASP